MDEPGGNGGGVTVYKGTDPVSGEERVTLVFGDNLEIGFSVAQAVALGTILVKTDTNGEKN